MLNPTYLIRSRHAIYYFRYPLPEAAQVPGKTNRISISLQTRCPNEALRLAKILEYHAFMLTEDHTIQQKTHAEIMAMFKQHFAEVLERAKKRIDRDGPLPRQNVHNIEQQLAELAELIDTESDDIDELYAVTPDNPEEREIHKQLQPIMERHQVNYKPGSREYRMMSAAFKYALRNHYKDLLTYNSQATDYSLLDSGPTLEKATTVKPVYQLQHVIAEHLTEIKDTVRPKTLEDRQACLAYLTELLGADFSINNLDGERARHVKASLKKTPKGRTKNPATRDLPLLRQLEVEGVARLSNRSINKYLDYFSSLCEWARKNNYIADNPFTGMALPDKKGGKREPFNSKDLTLIFAELEKGEGGLANNDLKYWSTLLFLYTGARRNEIASLTPDDVKKDKQSGIWYFDINDEEETKRIKTEAAKRHVPVHSALIERGFLDYVAKVKSMEGEDMRLLYSLTYSEKHGWGRKLTRWFSDKLLPELGIKRPTTSLHSTRHTVVTKLRAAGVDRETVGAIVGHEPDNVTDAVYTHYGLEHLPMMQEALEKLQY